MKSDSFSMTALRTSRSFAAFACLAGASLFACWAYLPPVARVLGVLLPPPLAALTIVLLSLSVLMAHFKHVGFRVGAQVLAARASGIALSSVVQTWAGRD